MKYIILLLLLPSIALGEALSAQYTEPAGTIQDTSLWVCIQKRNDSQLCTCTNFQRVVVTPDQSGATAATINPSYNIPIKADELPLSVRWSATARTANGNETAPLDVTPVCHVFTSP